MSRQTSKLVDPIKPITREFLENPYPTYKKFREEEPVFWNESEQHWLLFRYADVNFVAHDLRFGKRLHEWKGASPLKKFGLSFFPSLEGFGNTMLNQNPPEHTHQRSLVNKAFTPRMVEKMLPRIQKIADDLLDKVQAKGSMDFIADFAFPLPITVIAEMLGVPHEDFGRFHGWSRNLAGSLDPSADPIKLLHGLISARECRAYLKPIVRARKNNPQEDLISALATAEESGVTLTEGEVIANVILLLVAGHETTVNLISNSLLALMSNPDQFSLLKQKPELIATAVDEFLRYDSPVQQTRRIALEDVEVGGKMIRKGDMLVPFLGAANRDPARFPDPDRLDITRADNKHLAFGFGIHHCLGAALAWNEGDVAISTVLKRMPNIKLACDPAKLEHKIPFTLRGVKSMPVTF